MFAIQSNILWFFIFIHVSNCGRRIQGGIPVKAEKPYVVYFVKAPLSKSGYDYWLCGGALVTPDFVVTSAACIKDVNFLYVIAGYNKYVTDREIDLDPCTSKMKKKVIFTCYPEGYNLRYDRLDKWSLIDIGVAKVESPYEFTDQSYKTLCSYIPGTIPINFESKYQQAGVDAIVLGWGHKIQWRQPEDTNNYNQEYLNFAPVMILDKKECKGHYVDHGRMTDVIDAYMICTLDNGNINEKGEPMDNNESIKVLEHGCSKRKSLAFDPEAAYEDCEYDDVDDRTRREIKISSNDSMIKTTNKNNFNEATAETKTTIVSNKTYLANITAWSNRTTTIKRFALTNKTALTQKNRMFSKTHNFNETVKNTRRYGICQNDHGGPLVTWVGTHEVLIGVASVFKVSDEFKCEGPYLYTSTQCNGAFLDCILDKARFEGLGRRSSQNISVNISRRSFCRKSSDDVKHPTTERHISWLYHPAGAADHERHAINGRNKPRANKKTPEINEENISSSGISINPVNKMIPANGRYPAVENNQNVLVNDNITPHANNVVNENTAPNINQRGTPNNKHVPYNQYPPSNIPRMKNNNYSPNNGPASYSGPVLFNGPTLNNETPLNYKPAQIDDAASSEPEVNFKSERGNIFAPNNRPELNFRSERVNNFALNSKPVINIKSERNNEYAQIHGPVLNKISERVINLAPNNEPAQNIGHNQTKGPAHDNVSTLNNVLSQNYKLATNSRLKPKDTYAVAKKPKPIQNIGAKIMMRPTIPPRM